MSVQNLILCALLLYISTCYAVPATFTLSGTLNINAGSKDASSEDNEKAEEISDFWEEYQDFYDETEPKETYNDFDDILRPLKEKIDLGEFASSSSSSSASKAPKRPHIFMIVADDLGWNDVSWRDQTMYTPVLTKLASEGVVLNHSYVQPVCSPSRAAFMSGYYPYHLGMQHDSLRATQQAYLPGNVTTLPEHLKSLGYKTHMAGKWHLGFCNWKYTPTYRGFDSFVGFYNAIQDYYTHIGHRHGYDFRHNKDVYWKANGTYSAFIFTQYIQQVISDHDPADPLFVYLPYQSVHGPLQVPQQYIDKYCSHIHNASRRTHCGMVAALDEGVGNITQTLKDKGLYDDTIILFTTDNGGPVHDASNNWPLRGSKATLWEGGTRGTAFLHGPKFFKNSGSTYDGIIHAVDWMPTLVEAAGGPTVTGTDGVSQWQSILQDKVPSARTEFVYNFDEKKKNSAIRMGKWKLLEGKPGDPDGWYPPPTMEITHSNHLNDLNAPRIFGNINIRIHDEAGFVDEAVLADAQKLSDLFENVVMNVSLENSLLFKPSLRQSQSDIIARMTSEEEKKKNDYLLFDLEADPYEHNDVKGKNPDVFKQMVARMEEYRKSLVPANWPPHDPASFPTNFDGTWSPGWC